jgi:hypothetical protein
LIATKVEKESGMAAHVSFGVHRFDATTGQLWVGAQERRTGQPRYALIARVRTDALDAQHRCVDGRLTTEKFDVYRAQTPATTNRVVARMSWMSGLGVREAGASAHWRQRDLVLDVHVVPPLVACTKTANGEGGQNTVVSGLSSTAVPWAI